MPRFGRRRGYASGETGGGDAPFVGIGAGRGEGELDAPRADADEAGELEELEPDRAAGRVGELSVDEADAPDRADENIGDEASQSLSLLARRVAVEVRLANRSPWSSLIRFSISPLSQ